MTFIQCRPVSNAPLRCVGAGARRRVTDYSARRAGGQEENYRRSRTSREYQSPTDQPGYQNGTGRQRSQDYGSASTYETQEVQPSPQVLRRRSADYSSRRSGGQEENQRRSRDFSRRNGRTPLYDERGMGSRGSGSAPPRVQAHRGGSTSTAEPASPPPWAPPSPPRESFDSYSKPEPAKRRVSRDPYGSRRPGKQDENERRFSGQMNSPGPSSNGRAVPSFNDPSQYTPPTAQQGMASSFDTTPREVGTPHIQRKRSMDYGSRRAGVQEENYRRSRDYLSPEPSASSAPSPRNRNSRVSSNSVGTGSPTSINSAQSAPPSTPATRPRVQPKRRSTDYPSRQPGGQEENQRRSRDFSSPTPAGRSSQSTTRTDFRPARASRSPPRQEEDVRPRDFVPLTDERGYVGGRSNSSSSNIPGPPAGVGSPRISGGNIPRVNGLAGGGLSPAQAAGQRNAERRRSGNYNERRSTVTSQENSRRRSVDMISGEIREPDREGPPGRRSSRGGGFDKTEDSYVPSPPPDYSASKKVKGVPKDFTTAEESIAYRREQEPASGNIHAGPANIAVTDWPRVIAGNLPAAFLVFAGLAAIDVSSGFDITRLAVRYGGPGAPTASVLAFWPTALVLTGAMSSVVTSALNLEAFGLKAKCPECGADNRAGFKGVMGGRDGEITHVECENCMADLRFDLPNRRVTVERGSEDKKREALERGRQQALRVARMEAEEAQREAQQYMDKGNN